MIDGKVFGLETMRNKTWVSRDHLRIANIIWLTVLFLATVALTTVVFEKPATTQSSNPIVLDETRNRIPPKPVPTTTTSTTTLPPVKKISHYQHQRNRPVKYLQHNHRLLNRVMIYICDWHNVNRVTRHTTVHLDLMVHSNFCLQHGMG